MPGAGLTEADYVQTILDAIAEHERGQETDPEPKLRTKLILSVRSFHRVSERVKVGYC